MSTLRKKSNEMEYTSSQLGKLEHIALNTLYSLDQISVLEELLLQSGNSRVGIELLLGIYEYPEVNEVGTIEFRNDHINKKFVSFNKFNNTVYYSYNSQIKESFWFRKDCNDFQIANSVAKGSYWDREEACKYYNSTSGTDVPLTLREFEESFKRIEIVIGVNVESTNYEFIDLENWNKK